MVNFNQVPKNKIICHMSEHCGKNRHNPSFEAAIYILASLGDASLIEQISESGIDFGYIFGVYNDRSAEEQSLVKLAAAVHNPDKYPVTVNEVFARLSRKQRKTAIWGLLIRYPAVEGI